MKLSHDFVNVNNNALNKSQNGKELKDNKALESKPLNRSMNIAHVSSIHQNQNQNQNQDQNSINPNLNNSNNNNNLKINNSIFKKSDSSSIGIIEQEDNEDEKNRIEAKGIATGDAFFVLDNVYFAA